MLLTSPILPALFCLDALSLTLRGGRGFPRVTEARSLFSQNLLKEISTHKQEETEECSEPPHASITSFDGQVTVAHPAAFQQEGQGSIAILPQPVPSKDRAQKNPHRHQEP
jgi:hypothetical protein